MQQTKQWIAWLWRQKGSPSQRAKGVAAGIFSGCFPLFGLQTLIGIFLAKIIRGNALLAAGGTWISNPFTYLPIYWFNYKVGCLLLGEEQVLRKFNQLDISILLNQSWYLSIRLLIGSSIVGLISAISIGGLTYIILKSSSTRKYLLGKSKRLFRNIFVK